MSFRVDWLAPDTTGGAPFGPRELAAPLRRAQAELETISVRRICAAFDDLAAALLDRSNPLLGRFPGSGLPFLARLCEGRNLAAMVGDSLGGLDHLDRFLPRESQIGREGRAYPRGIAVHWLAGNVPTLGVLSLISAMMTKNASVVRVPSAANELLAELMRMFHGMGEAHRLLAGAVAVVRYNRNDATSAEALSGMADVRIIWGSDETTTAIRALPSKPSCVDVVFRDRTSFTIVGRTYLTGEHADRTARLIAHDASVFEQKACASPHTVFLSTDSDDELDAFCERLDRAMNAVLRQIPKQVPTPRESAAILNLRSQYAMFHKTWHPSGLEYTILADRGERIGPPIGNRTLYVRKLPPDKALVAAIPENVQTVGLAADGEESDRLTNLLGAAGVHRITAPGGMTQFELPWDGIPVPQCLVRWTLRPAAGGAEPPLRT